MKKKKQQPRRRAWRLLLLCVPIVYGFLCQAVFDSFPLDQVVAAILLLAASVFPAPSCLGFALALASVAALALWPGLGLARFPGGLALVILVMGVILTLRRPEKVTAVMLRWGGVALALTVLVQTLRWLADRQ